MVFVFNCLGFPFAQMEKVSRQCTKSNTPKKDNIADHTLGSLLSELFLLLSVDVISNSSATDSVSGTDGICIDWSLSLPRVYLSFASLSFTFFWAHSLFGKNAASTAAGDHVRCVI